jgi:hypothetical protein
MEQREERARADSLDRASTARQLTSREHLMQVQATARAYQARADTALDPWGIRAPSPVAGEPLDAYRRNLLILAKKQLPEDHELRRVTVRQLPSSALSPFEDQIYAACKDAAYRPDSVPPGNLRRVEEVDANGLKIVKFVGQECFVKEFTRPVARFVFAARRRIRGGFADDLNPRLSPRFTIAG